MVKLISIKQKYSSKIFSKEKLAEYRRQNVDVKKGEKCIVYTSSPVKKITGYFIVKEKIRLPIAQLWAKTKEFAGITKAEFMEYFEGCKEGTALIFKYVKMFINQISIKEMRSFIKDFRPPQSYYNLSEAILNMIVIRAGEKVPSLADY